MSTARRREPEQPERRAFLATAAVFGLALAIRTPALAAAVQEGAAPAPEPADAASGATASDGTPFDFEWLVAEAERLAAADHAPRGMTLPDGFDDLSYDQYRDIRFARERDPLARSGSPFGMDVLPPGFLFTVPVRVNLVRDGQARPIPFSLDDFTFGPLAPRPASADGLAHSGFRLRAPINRPDVLDEIAVFQGASYFRAVARGERYGLSARGLSIGTASETGEEFPAFTDFWIEVPPADATSITLWALLDSASVSGAYRFEVTPGPETTMRIESVLFPRRDLDDVGIAPLTSMFLFDPSNRIRFDDYREAVHDSDGLQMIDGAGERMFRSLANPVQLQVSSFADTDPTAFGLVQRHRALRDYEDTEARYDLRPCAWVQPEGNWGEGAVVLVEIPTDAEIHDNISVLWRPAEPLAAGARHEFAYRLTWTDDPSDDVGIWRFGDLRTGTRDGLHEIVVYFERPDGTTGGDLVDPGVELDVSAGEASDVVGSPVGDGARYRVSFAFDPGESDLAEMRLRLHDTDDRSLSETWLYRWTS